ncbi:RNA-directed DNA polymerase [Kribbella sindirgiensis]|uniref:RNA-directed DNA polymerase n=1 Tax=Kribbella sindirgiensis TaxID=1124744 RepID=A0A4V2M206_9ACTN|nr:RNA-directed DNA polymerase [Kribbella sindirgiensis]TCC21316.1 RNA-directed DNA polymerase [Kribbella sindirgiensis]
MTEQLSNLPSALQYLNEVLTAATPTPVELHRALRGLQLLGLSRSEIEVHVERARAANDASDMRPEIERNALDALDILSGVLPRYHLDWGAAEIASIRLRRVITDDVLNRGAKRAYLSNNLLPGYLDRDIDTDALTRATTAVYQSLSDLAAKPLAAEFVRAAKSGLTSRPAAMLRPQDAIVYGALAEIVARNLTRHAPDTVKRSPEGQDPAAFFEFKKTPLDWDVNYVISADIESFYECVEHELLTFFMRRHLRVAGDYADALESFLDAVMDSRQGLPQGPAASEIFASAYLLPVDLELNASGWQYTRYADDFLIGASSIGEARAKLRSLENLLQEIGLRLNTGKTFLFRAETYRRAVTDTSPVQERVQHELLQVANSRTEAISDEILNQTLEAIANRDSLISSISYDDRDPELIIDELESTTSDILVEAYERYFLNATSGLEKRRLSESYGETEQLIRESLMILGGARHFVPLIRLSRVISWFPQLTRHVVAYLEIIAPQHTNLASAYIRERLRTLEQSEWTLAWFCRIPRQVPALVDSQVESALRDLLRNSDSSLVRASAARALAAAGRLAASEERELLDHLSDVARADYEFDAILGKTRDLPNGVEDTDTDRP